MPKKPHSRPPSRYRQHLLALPLGLALIVASILAWRVGAHAKIPSTHSAEASREMTETPCRPGKWGNLKYARIMLEPPDNYAQENLGYVHATKWFFKAVNREELLSQLHTLGFNATEFNFLLRDAKWEAVKDGFWITPGEPLVLHLSSDCRIKLYRLLASYPENGFYHNPFVFRPEVLPSLLENSGLSSTSLKTFTNLLYPRNTLLLFSDIGALMSLIPDKAEQIRLIKTISRKNTLLVKMTVNPSSDLEGLLDYWSEGGRTKDLRPLLESLSRVPDGCALDISHLLPTFVRKRIYTYPTPASSSDQSSEDCHWTSLNFLNEPPDDRFGESQNVAKIFAENYDVIRGEKKLGDILLFLNAKDDIIHSAVYIADDIVFTKNGGRRNQPWIFMKLEDLMPYYSFSGEPVQLVYCRKKVGPAVF